MTHPEPTRKPRVKPKPYERKLKAPAPKDPMVHRTTAKHGQIVTKCENLTLHDWMTVFAYMDEHPLMSQGDIAKHFESKQDGALIFNQSTLSRKVKAFSELKKRVSSFPNALSLKRPRIVMRPDVERALVLWVRHMEEKGKMVNGPMLRGKWGKFEEQFDVPDTERPLGNGWITPFCKAHGLKECRRHGEAGSVDLEAVEAECKHVALTLMTYAPQDWWNVDELALFAL
jgi:Tc5 transposase DNA-binding domain